MFGLSSLLGAAWEFRTEGRPVVAVLDAGRGEVFFGAYQPIVAGLTTLVPPCLVPRSAISNLVSQVIGQTDVVYVGLGHIPEEGYRRPKRTALGLVEAFLVEKRTDARSIDLEPEYLRAVAAKTIRERVETASGQLSD